MTNAPGSEEAALPNSSRRRASIALVVAIVAVLAVIFGAKYMQDAQAAQPVALSNPELPDNDSPACAELLERLPDRAAGLVRAEVAEPAPPGAAVYRNIEDARITLRCGTPVPAQYNPLANTTEVDGVRWLQVLDGNDESLSTWFSVGRTPVVALTAERGASAEPALADIAEAMRPDAHWDNAPSPGPVPLADVAAPEADRRCEAFVAALPKELGGRQLLSAAELPAGVDEKLQVWAGTAADPVTLRCGVEEPAGYAVSERLTQVGDIVWFNEPSLSSGTSGTWYALGRERFVAVNLPMADASGLLPALSEVIAANLANTAPSEAN